MESLEMPGQNPLEYVDKTTYELFKGIEKGHAEAMEEFLKLTNEVIPKQIEKRDNPQSSL